MIKIKNISKKYQLKDEYLQALDNVTLTVEEGSIFGVIGLSGAGKSTLLRSIAGLEKVNSGEIFIDGVNIGLLKGRTLRDFKREVGVVFQGFNLLFQRDIFSNIALPLKLAKIDKTIISKRVYELLDLVGLKDKANAYPSQLSGGQKQRVAIARALANNPKVLLLDEITSALDPKTTKQILQLLLDIKSKYNVTILLITHEINIVNAICDKVAVLNYGKIVEINDAKTIINNPTSVVTRMLLGKEDIYA